MDPLMKALYFYFYRDEVWGYENLKKILGDRVSSRKSIEHLFRTPGAQDFIQRHTVFGSSLYFRVLEIKSKEAREEWGREAVHHTRSLKNIRKK
jgi:hypothetical protein